MSSERERKRAMLAMALGYIEREGVSFGAAGALPVGSEWERKSSVREASLKSDVGVPLSQSLVTGILAGILTAVALGWQAGAIVGVVVCGVCWALLLTNHVDQLWSTERLLGHDIDGDEILGKPERVVRVELVSDGGRSLRWMDMPIGEDKLRRVAQAVGRGVSFSRPGLCGAGILSQGEFNKLASAMLEAGLAIEGPGNKRELSASGRALMRELLE